MFSFKGDHYFGYLPVPGKFYEQCALSDLSRAVHEHKLHPLRSGYFLKSFHLMITGMFIEFAV